MGGPCDYGVSPVPIGLGFWTGLGIDFGLRGPDLGLGLDNQTGRVYVNHVNSVLFTFLSCIPS